MIRNAVLEDIDEIYNLNTELFIVLSELKKDIYNPIGFPKEFITSIINSNESDYIVIEEDDKIIGYSLIEERKSPFKKYPNFKEDHFASIDELVILPQYRTKGYGKILMEESEKWAKKRNLTSLEISVLNNNFNARAFYEKSGFEEFQLKLRKGI